MKYLAILGAVVVMGIAFQNCGREGFQTPIDDSPIVGGENQRLGPLVQQDQDDFPLVRKSQEHDMVMGQKTDLSEIVINLNKETVEARRKNGQKETRQLPSDLAQKSKEIFRSSEVCQAPEVPADRVCTLIYRFPYAELIDEISGSIIRLGEARDGCGTGAIDFCEATARQSFKEVLSEVSNNFETYPEK